MVSSCQRLHGAAEQAGLKIAVQARETLLVEGDDTLLIDLQDVDGHLGHLEFAGRAISRGRPLLSPARGRGWVRGLQESFRPPLLTSPPSGGEEFELRPQSATFESWIEVRRIVQPRHAARH